MSEKNIVFLGDKYLNYEDAKLPVRTHAFLYGTSVFEGIRAYWNEEHQQLYIFRMKEHYERLMRSAKIMRRTFAVRMNGTSSAPGAVIRFPLYLPLMVVPTFPSGRKNPACG